MPENQTSDRLTVAAIAMAAMSVVTFDHEALGHGSICLALGGRILLVTSSLFHCDLPSGWIDPGGPLGNLLMGALALGLRHCVPARFSGARLFLLLVTLFGWFWEAGYVLQAMLKQQGDLYFFLRFLLGDVAPWQRLLAAAAGLALYVVTARIAVRGLLAVGGDAATARSVARTAWLAATIGAGIAALGYAGHGWGDLRDALMEIGAASFPLLLLPRNSTGAGIPVARNWPAIAFCLLVYVAFAATLGRGVTG